MDGLDEAVASREEAVSLIQHQSPYIHAMTLNHFGKVLMTRFRRNWLMDDLDNAIDIFKGALKQSEKTTNNVLLVSCLKNLGTALAHRSKRNQTDSTKSKLSNDL